MVVVIDAVAQAVTKKYNKIQNKLIYKTRAVKPQFYLDMS